MHTLRLGCGVILAGLLVVIGLEPLAHGQEKPKRPPIWSRLARANTVVLGTVEAIEDKTVEAVADPTSKEKHTYKIAKVKVTEVLVGNKELKEVKVGFFKDDELKPEKEGVFILTPHFQHPFFHFSDSQYDLFTSDSINYNVWTKILRDAGKLLETPTESLKSQEARERLLTAAVIISRYREPTVGTKTEPIDVEQSKLLLRVLRDADWGKEDKPYRLHPKPVFDLLGIGAKEGFNPPKDAKDITGARLAAENWLIDNHAKYRITRFVPDMPPK